jgi:hypothetical protein
MKSNQPNAWGRLVFSLGIALFLSLLVFVTLKGLPTAAANQFPICKPGEAPPTPPASSEVFTITGTISDQNETPVECVRVFAFSGAAQSFTYTHSSGRYTLTLSTGIYDLVFHPPITSGLASQGRRWIRESQVLNMTLPPGYLISGTVYSDITKTKTVSNVNIFASNPDTFVGLGANPTGPTGTYAISLEEGRWELTFTPPHFLGLGPTRTAIISLTQNVIQDIVLPPGFTIYGRVRNSGGQGQANADIFAQDPSQSQGYGITATDQDGFYTGTLPAGNFDMLFFAPPSVGLGSTVVTNIAGPPDVRRNVTLPAGYTVSGTIRCGCGLANTFIEAAPQPPLSAGGFHGWGRFAGADGFYAMALQPGVYTFTVNPPGVDLPDRVAPLVEVTQDMTLNFDYHCLFLPIILKSS